MKVQNYYILMADVIGSSTFEGAELLHDFKRMITWHNKQFAADIISPLTITLGDEFQGVIGNLQTCMQLIIGMEEYAYTQKLAFKLRYSLHYGVIDTPINHKIAHGMVGAGLTRARENIFQLKKEKHSRFLIAIGSPIFDRIFNHLFVVYQSMVDNWKQEDTVLVSAFLQYGDYKLVAKAIKKDVSLIWRRKKSLQIHEYLSLKQAILESTLLK